ncbi:MAG: class I SAM-dependent methyltransferase [Desulfobacterales bacterium]
MSHWIFIILGLAAGLFVIKIAYVTAVALSIKNTQGALYVSTSQERIRAVLDEFDLKRGQVLIDLGCGDGRALRAARRRSDISAIGYEINPLAYVKARIYSLGAGIDIRHRNFWNEAIDAADIIFCYLFPDVMTALAEKIRAEAKPGAVIVSFNFPIPAFTPIKVLRPAGARQNDPIYFYRLPC